MRALLIAISLGALALVLAACGPTTPGSDGPAGVDPRAVARVLSTQPGLVEAGPAVIADVTAVQAALAGRADAEGVTRLEGAGFEAGAIRTWRTPGGDPLVIVVTRWGDAVAATNVGAGSAELILGEPGASAWTPKEVPGSRGVRVDDGRRTLARGVGANSIVLRAEGAVPDEAIIRTMELAIIATRGADADEGG